MGSRLSRPRRPPSPSRTPDDLLVLPVVLDLEKVDEVFENDLLLDLILTRVLLKPLKDRKGKLTFSIAEARVLRQVCHRWMLTVSSLFLRTRQPLLCLEVTDTQPERLESLMEGFEMSTLYTSGSTSALRSSLPPFSLSLAEVPWSLGWFPARWKTPFYPLMVQFGGTSSMVQLRIRDKFFSQNPPPNLPSYLVFSTLQKVTLEYGNDVNFDASVDPFYAFIQTILDQSLELREFSFEWHKTGRPSFARSLTLPQSITHLQTITGDTGAPISPLQPPLRQLTSLKVQNMSAEYERDLFKFLCGVRLSLEHLCLERPWTRNENLVLILTEFPVFPKLKTFILQGQLILTVSNTRREKFAKFPAVQSLTLLLADSAPRFGQWTPILLETLIQIRSNFPCVAHMNVTINWRSLHGLRSLFQLMEDQLKVLNIKFEEDYTTNGQLFFSDLKYDMEGLFLGTTGEMSIRNLKNLEHLSVTGKYSRWITYNNGLVSSFCVRYAFLRMPRLKHLTMGGCFRVSKRSVRLWRRAGGRTIDNQR